MNNKNNQISEEELAEKLLIEDVCADFEKRQTQRRSFETQWALNMNFLIGNQFCNVSPAGELSTIEKHYNWQHHDVYNHIAPIIERRLSKLQRVRPVINVFPASGDDRDVKTAKVTKKIINSVYNKNDMTKTIAEVTQWSEICGTGFYKIIWNSGKGMKVAKTEFGKEVKSGDVDIIPVSPFEIFPESSSITDISNSRSLIHARAYHVDEIKNQWGVDIKGCDVNVFTLDKCFTLGYVEKSASIQSTRSNYAIVIERYEAPSIKFPNGRLVIVCEDKLLFVGELPYINGTDGSRVFPFVRQVSLSQPGCFWGLSIIQRLIPLQRTFNAIKNRKHEFLNRLSMGVLTVEDGSVDLDELEDEGLKPGKVLVYRNGANPPKYMQNDSIPFNFTTEEEAILEEFASLSGVSDFSSNNYLTKNLSGVALELLIEQDESKIVTTSESIKDAIKEIAKQTLRLYKQFVKIPKLTKIIGDNGEMEIFYFTSSDITTDDIVFETKDEAGETFSQRRNMVFELLNAGLFSDENGKISNRMKTKILDMIGFGVWENTQDLEELHIARAGKENLMFLNLQSSNILPIDDHKIHINEHTAFVLGGEIENLSEKDAIIQNLLKHIEEHKKRI